MTPCALLEGDTVGELIDARAALTPDATMCIDDQGGELTFAAYREQVRRRARELVDLGISAGSTVCWQLPNSVAGLAWFGAASLIGARQAPMPIVYRRSEIAALLRLAQADLVLSAGNWNGRDYDGMVAEAINDSGRDIAQHSAMSAPADATWDGKCAVPALDVRYLYATSGSTGTPKMALHTDVSVLAWARAQSAAQHIGPHDVVAYCVSLAHIAGAYAVGQALICGNAALLLNGFDAERTTAEMARHGTTVIIGVPTVYSGIVEAWRTSGVGTPLTRLRFCASGAAPKPPELHSDVQTVIGGRGLVTSYGMSEAGAIAVGWPEDTDEQLEHTVGKPVAGITLRIVAADGARPDDGAVGEIRVKGLGVFAGYSDETLNSEVFDEDGFFRTGDLGTLRADGHLTIVGRLKDVIIRKGENIVPQEIENVLFRLPVVREAVVVGVNDPQMGERVCAVVSLVPGVELTLEQVTTACLDDGLMMQKVPELLHVMDDIPKTPTGKADKVRLRAELEVRAAQALPS